MHLTKLAVPFYYLSIIITRNVKQFGMRLNKKLNQNKNIA